MLKKYEIGGLVFKFEEGEQPEGAVEVKAKAAPKAEPKDEPKKETAKKAAKAENKARKVENKEG